MENDRDLVLAVKRGDERALALVLSTYQRPLYGAVYPVLVDHAAAEDVLQEAFVRFWKTIDRFDPELPLFPWLRRIAVNLALNRAGQKKRRHVSIENAPEPAVQGCQEERVMEQEEVQRAEEALGRLDPDRRAVLTLRAVQGLSYAEIAETLGIALGTVMSRLFRARLELREILGSHVPEARLAR
ncbi:MAG: RNA polymerase sigma factor [Planctomycetes bacterium]|nr:RNA polymerase sigma factor [Planctomycetota bacterium]